MLTLVNPKEVVLTETEVAILRLTCEEKTTKEIASLLEKSPRTIESIRDKLREKTGAKGFAGLTIFALQANLVSLS